MPDAIPTLDDEAAPDPPEAETEAAPETPALIPTAVIQRGMKPPPMFAAVAGPVTPVVSQPHAGIQAERMPTTMVEQDASMDDSGGAEQSEVAEPSAKRQKLTMRRIGGEELYHMDSEPYDSFDGLEVDEFYSYDSLYDIDSSDEFDYDMQEDATTKIASGPNEVSVWQPYRGSEPEISHDVLALIDQQADKIEIQRLLEMGVITTVDKYDGQLDVALSAKMVRTWRKKTKVEIDGNGVSKSYPAWMRRSRLVGRDFNFLSYREDVYSPASSSSVVKLLPSLALSDGFVRNAVLATLDVSDAFLQVPQPIPRKVFVGRTGFSLSSNAFLVSVMLRGSGIHFSCRDCQLILMFQYVQSSLAYFDVRTRVCYCCM